MKKVFSSLLTLSAILPLMWWSVVPNAADNCKNGVPVPYAYTQDVYHEDGSVTQIHGTYTQDQWFCDAVRDFPKPR